LPSRIALPANPWAKCRAAPRQLRNATRYRRAPC